MQTKNTINYSDFEKIDMRIGTILKAEDFTNAKKPAYKLAIDFGELGIKKSSAQITNYTKEELVGIKVVAVVNFPPKQVADFISEVLVLGALTSSGVILLVPSRKEEAKPGDAIA